jgi:hypothetical protein
MASFSMTMTMFTKTLILSTWVHWISNQLICVYVYQTILIVGLVHLYINICSLLSLDIYIKHHSSKDLLPTWTIKFFHINNIGYTSPPKLMYISLLHLDGTSFRWMWTLLLVANAIWYYLFSKIWDKCTWLKTRLLVFFTLVAHYMLGSTWTSCPFQGVWNLELQWSQNLFWLAHNM